MGEDSGVHNTLNIRDLAPYHDDTKLRIILFVEGGLKQAPT